jgi:hypothetical protein
MHDHRGYSGYRHVPIDHGREQPCLVIADTDGFPDGADRVEREASRDGRG